MGNNIGTLPLGHVTYVVDPEKLKALAGRDRDFLLAPVKDPFYLTLIVVTLVVVVAAFAACEIVPNLRTAGRAFHNRLLTHEPFVPMTLRIALGIALLVSGTNDTIYLPNVSGNGLGGLEVAGHVTFFGSLVVLMVTGGGNYSVDALIAKWARNATGTTTPYLLAEEPDAR